MCYKDVKTWLTDIMQAKIFAIANIQTQDLPNFKFSSPRLGSHRLPNWLPVFWGPPQNRGPRGGRDHKRSQSNYSKGDRSSPKVCYTACLTGPTIIVLMKNHLSIAPWTLIISLKLNWLQEGTHLVWGSIVGSLYAKVSPTRTVNLRFKAEVTVGLMCTETRFSNFFNNREDSF